MFAASMAGAAVADDDVTETPEAESEAPHELNDAQMFKATMIADYFAGEDATEEDLQASVDAILEYRTGEEKVGWGAIYKLMLLSEAGVEVEMGEDGWGFGQYFKQLRDEDPEWLGDAPKNLGQLKKQARQEAKAERKANKGNRKNGG